MVLYPIASAVSGYYGVKRRKIEGKESCNEKVEFFSALVNMVIYIVVAKALF